MSTKYQQMAASVFAMQYIGSNQDDMLSFAPGFLYLKDGILMQEGNPYSLDLGEWVLQYRNTIRKGEFFRQTDDIFKVTWQIGGP